MSDKLVEFANALDIDPTLQSKYKENPKQTLQEFGVAPEDIDIILGEDMTAIRERLEMSGLKATLSIGKAK